MKCNKRVDYIISYFKVQNTYTLNICYKNCSDFATSLRDARYVAYFFSKNKLSVANFF